MKPSFANVTKNDVQPRIFQNDTEILIDDNSRERKRSKREREPENEPNEVFSNSDNDYQQQNRRGFLNTHNRQNRAADNISIETQNGQQPPRKPSNSHWKQKLPMVTGQSKEFGFAAPVDLFVFNVNKDVTTDSIVGFMKSSKGLDILECNKVSHVDARTQSFRIKVKAEDYDKALNGDTWPYRVRVRVYRHFRQRDEGGQFELAGQGRQQNADQNHIRQEESQIQNKNGE